MIRLMRATLLMAGGCLTWACWAQDSDLDALFADQPGPASQAPETESAEEGDQSASTPVVELPANESPAIKSTSRSRMVEEIVVTAQKREESLQDVPVSVQAFSGAMLDAMGVEDQTDLQRITPGLNITSQVSYVVTFLRGIGTDAFITTDPSVATYIDGVYFPFASNLAQQFGSVERIEVLKGPQGTLFGRNATGGAIAIHTKEPQFEEFSGDLTATLGSFNKTLLRGYANVPLGDHTAFSASAVWTGSDNFYTGTTGNPPEPFARDKTLGLRFKLRMQPGDNWDIRLAMTHLEMEGSAANVAFTTEPSTLATTAGVEAQSGYDGSLDFPIYTRTDPNQVFYGSVAYNAPWFDFKILASDQRMETAGSRDFDGSPQALSSFETPDQFVDAQSAEVQLLSNAQSGPDWLQWIIGGYYFAGVNGFQSLDFTIAGLDLAAGTTPGGLRVPVALSSLFAGAPTPSGPINMVGLVGTDSRALFGQTTLTLSDWLDMTLGLRYQIEERFIEDSSAAFKTVDGERIEFSDNQNTATDSDGNPYPAHDTTTSLSPKLSFQFRPFEDDTLIFLSWQEALKAGTYNTVAIYDAPDYVEPEEIEAWELGIKTTFLDGLVRFNAAVFHYDVVNLQTQFLSIFEGGVISFQNAGASKVFGFDFDGMVQILPGLVDDLVLSGGAAWLKTEYLDFANASGFDEQGTFNQDNDFTGNQIVRSPEFTATASLSKTWGVPGGLLDLVTDAYFTDEFFYEPGNREVSTQKAYSTLDARLSYLYEPWDFRATLSANNITEAFYTNGIFVTDFGVQRSHAAPRNYTLQLLWNF
ncbi:MAG: TonB-dependent receptor [Oceanococcus sp.]